MWLCSDSFRHLNYYAQYISVAFTYMYMYFLVIDSMILVWITLGRLQRYSRGCVSYRIIHCITAYRDGIQQDMSVLRVTAAAESCLWQSLDECFKLQAWSFQILIHLLVLLWPTPLAGQKKVLENVSIWVCLFVINSFFLWRWWPFVLALSSSVSLPISQNRQNK